MLNVVMLSVIILSTIMLSFNRLANVASLLESNLAGNKSDNFKLMLKR
jgi:hypothetical protein